MSGVRLPPRSTQPTVPPKPTVAPATYTSEPSAPIAKSAAPARNGLTLQSRQDGHWIADDHEAREVEAHGLQAGRPCVNQMARAHVSRARAPQRKDGVPPSVQRQHGELRKTRGGGRTDDREEQRATAWQQVGPHEAVFTTLGPDQDLQLPARSR